MAGSFTSHPYAQLIRLDKPVGVWLLLLPCYWGVIASGYSGDITLYLLFAIGAFAMRSAGCIVNDIADKNIDAQISRTATRPLAAGIMRMSEAYMLLLGLLIIALIVAAYMGWHVVLLGLCWLPLVALYPRMKRITWWPQAFLGITFGAGPLFGSMAVLNNISITSICLYCAAISWVIGYDTIYACQDIVDDTKVGVKSTARLFGTHLKFGIGGFYAATTLYLGLALHFNDSFTADNIVLLAIIGMALLWQVQTLQPEKPALCLTLFKSNIWVGIAICLLMIPHKSAIIAHYF